MARTISSDAFNEKGASNETKTSSATQGRSCIEGDRLKTRKTKKKSRSSAQAASAHESAPHEHIPQGKAAVRPLDCASLKFSENLKSKFLSRTVFNARECATKFSSQQQTTNRFPGNTPPNQPLRAFVDDRRCNILLQARATWYQVPPRFLNEAFTRHSALVCRRTHKPRTKRTQSALNQLARVLGVGPARAPR